MGRKRSRPDEAFREDDEEWIEDEDGEEEDDDHDIDDDLEEEEEEPLVDEQVAEEEDTDMGAEEVVGDGGGPGKKMARGGDMGSGDYQCEVCGKRYTKQAYLTVHMRSHTGEKPFPCPVEGCGQSYSRKDHLERHLNSVAHLHDLEHHERQTFECTVPGCDKVYYNQCHLNHHIKTHSAPRPFVCTAEGCSESFIKRCQLRQHQVATHGEPAKYQCDKCGRGFPTKQKLTRHSATHEPRPCPEAGCDEVLPTYSEWRAHIAQHEKSKKKARVVMVPPVEERKAFACDFPGCTKSFTLKKNLRAHKRASHEDVRFSCPFPQCGGKSFRYKCTLDKHLARVHVNGEADDDEEEAEPDAAERLAALPEEAASSSQYRQLLLETLMGGPIEESVPPPEPPSSPPADGGVAGVGQGGGGGAALGSGDGITPAYATAEGINVSA